jgi:hypothetical protein
MTPAEYQMIQNQISLFAQLVEPLDLAGFIEMADRADTIGPFVDPTMWRDAHKNLDYIKSLAEALLEFQQASAKRPAVPA